MNGVDDVPCLVDLQLIGSAPSIRGKVRDTWHLPAGRSVVVTTDRQSAFDEPLPPIPHKGQVLNRMSAWWFEQTEDICGNHLLEVLDDNTALIKTLQMIPVEVVMRRYLTGSTSTSIWKQYQAGKREFGDHHLPDGMRKNQELEMTLVTPTTKAPVGQHDVPIAVDDIINSGLCSVETWAEILRVSHDLFERGRKVCAERGVLLVDTKYEFGLDVRGQLVLGDEIHTPDGSRFWLADTYADRLQHGLEPESLDKEMLRLWVTENGSDVPIWVRNEMSARYRHCYATVTGHDATFAIEDDPVARVRETLYKNFPTLFGPQYQARPQKSCDEGV